MGGGDKLIGIARGHREPVAPRLAPQKPAIARKGECGAASRTLVLTDQEITSFAAVWRPLEGGGHVFAFLTTDPNPLVAPIHPRAMPVLLHAEDGDKWLARSFDEAVSLATPYASQLMQVDEVVRAERRWWVAMRHRWTPGCIIRSDEHHSLTAMS